MTNSPNVLEFRNVSRLWRAGILGATGESLALSQCSFSLRRGEVLAVVGEAGAGKSTLLALAAAQAAPSEGSIRWCGVHDHEIARPQLVGPRPWEYNFLTVRQALAFHADQLTLNHAGIQRTTRFVPLMTKVGLRGMSKVRLGQLSALDKLRVVIAQALLAEPRLICCDEPIGYLGPSERLEAGNLLRSVAAGGVGLLLATREVSTLTALGIADSSLRLAAGRVVGGLVARRSVLELAVPRLDEAMLRLSTRLPSITRRGGRLRVPLAATTPEEVLAVCREAGVSVRGSRVAEEPL